jgi:hypothetical protein
MAGESDPRNHLDVKSQKHEVRREARDDRRDVHRRFKAKKLEARSKALRSEVADK